MTEEEILFAAAESDVEPWDTIPPDHDSDDELTDPLREILRPPLRLAGPDLRPDILITPEVHETTEHMMRAILVDKDLYHRGGALVHTIASEEVKRGEDVLVVKGTPVIRPTPQSYLTDRISRHARCVKKVKTKGGDEKWNHIPPPPNSVRAVLERGSWPGMRELRGILEAPSMRPDGTIIQTPGYDEATKYLYEPNGAFPVIPDAPTHSDAVAAYGRLCEPFAQFPYSQESHRSATIAAVLTLLARPAISGSVPCWLFDASSSRSGKSLQVDVVHILATGRPASRMTYPEQDDELEKVLSSYAMRGAASVNFDNVARKFGGSALDKCITAVDTVDLRVLGATELVTLPWTAIIFASGNNVDCRGDMLPRVLSPRLETPLDNPEQRSDLTISDLRAWTKKNRGDLVRAALTILRAYCVAGGPDQNLPKWGGFESWTRFVPQAIAWVGAPDPMGARRGLEGDDDPEKQGALALVTGWAALCASLGKATTGLTAREAIAHLYPGRDSPPDPLNDPLREAIEVVTDAKPGAPPSVAKLGYAIRRLKGKPIGRRRLLADGTVGGAHRWRVVQVT